MDKKKVLVGIILPIALLLTGCAGDSLLEKDPRCPFTERGGCYSIKEIHQMIDKNQYTLDGYVARPPKKRVVIQEKTMRIYVPTHNNLRLKPCGIIKVKPNTNLLLKY